MAVEMTEGERRALDISAGLWNAFIALPVQHPDDVNEFRHGLHALQRLILARVGHRCLQEES